MKVFGGKLSSLKCTSQEPLTRGRSSYCDWNFSGINPPVFTIAMERSLDFFFKCGIFKKSVFKVVLTDLEIVHIYTLW